MATLKLVGVAIGLPFLVAAALLSVVTSGALAIPAAPLIFAYFKRG